MHMTRLVAGLLPFGGAERHSRNAREMVETLFPENTMVDHYEKTFQELCGKSLQREAPVAN
jgi:hypothetical protein